MNLQFITAGAGSGKTHKLTELLYEKLAASHARPAGVIATTFTKKAASELRERVRKQLLEKQRFDLANRIGQARIGTVHSVCGDLLGRFSFELGLSPDLRIVDEAQAQALMNQAIDQAVTESELIEIGRLERLLSVHDWMAGRDWRSELKALADQARANNIAPTALQSCSSQNADRLLTLMGPASQDDLDAELKLALRHAIRQMEPRQAEKPQKNIGDYLAAARGLLERLESDDTTWSEWQAIAKLKSAAAFNAEVDNVAQAARRCEQHPRLRENLRDYLILIFTLASKTLSCYAARKAELGVLDFTDQECHMLAALDLPVVTEVLREELDLLLVDEFQDTSPIQLALFLKLAALAREAYWVGDIKQAIYGFRGSDTALMAAIVKKIPDLGGQLDNLPYSWRSRPALVDLVNAVFVPAFGNTQAANAVRLTPKRKDQLPEAAFAQRSLGGKKVGDQATALASGIAGLVASGYRVIDKKSEQPRTIGYADVAVLCRSNAGVQRVAQALRAQGIPAAIAQPGLLAQPEAVLALACLRRLNDPADTIASAEIVSMAGDEPPESWLSDRLQLVARHPDRDEARERALNAWREDSHPILKQLAALRREQMPLLAPREALQLAIVRCDLQRIVLGWQTDSLQARARLANLEALLDLAGQYEESCRNDGHPASVSGLLLWFKELVRDGEDALAEPAVEAVQVMTHHKAKGLEWPVVILMDLEDDVRDRTWSICAETQGNAIDATNPLKDRFIRYWPWPFGKQRKETGLDERLKNLDIGKQLRDQALEEEKRLLYVSMTRARDLLVFAWPGEKNTGEWFESISAPWLRLATDATQLALPDGKIIPCITQTLEPPEPTAGISQENTETMLHWFLAAAPAPNRQPLVFNPSASSEVAGTVAEKHDLGTRIAVVQGAEMNVLGTAIHACIAAAVVDRQLLASTESINAILQRLGADKWTDASAVREQMCNFFGWISARWPDAELSAEIPLESVFGNGQVMQGRIDLLIKTSQGWVVIDHKSNQVNDGQWETLAADYAGQLSAYAQALTLATGLPVLENWLFLPVAAALLRIEADQSPK